MVRIKICSVELYYSILIKCKTKALYNATSLSTLFPAKWLLSSY